MPRHRTAKHDNYSASAEHDDASAWQNFAGQSVAMVMWSCATHGVAMAMQNTAERCDGDAWRAERCDGVAGAKLGVAAAMQGCATQRQGDVKLR